MTARLTGGPTPGWRPLPECGVCGDPVSRATFDRNAGTCSGCAELVAAKVVVPDPERVNLVEWQALVAARGRQERLAAAERERRRQERRRRRG